MSTPKISINIVTYNGLKYLPHCLSSIKNQTFGDYQVLIIDNNSQDESLDFIQQNYPEFKILENKENLGFARAHNLGIDQNESEYILCLNQDIILEPNFLEEVIDFLDTNPKVGSVTSKLYFWDFKNQQKTNQIDSLGLKISKTFKISDISQGELDQNESNQPREIFGVSGAAPIYRRQALESIKLDGQYFDEDFFMYKEDVDLAFRLHFAGWQAFMISNAKAYHDRSLKSDANLVQNRQQRSAFGNYYSYRNHLFVLLKNVDLTTFCLYFPYIIGYEIAKLGYLIIFERKTLPAIIDFFKNFAKVWKKRKIIQKTAKIKQIRCWIK
ncbi:MAG: glycosyltransferase family 2 protein [Patescibacteria group bacterium]